MGVLKSALASFTTLFETGEDEAWFGFGRSTSAGEPISPYSAMSVSAYYAAARNISEDLGKLPFRTYRRVGEHPPAREARATPFEGGLTAGAVHGRTRTGTDGGEGRPHGVRPHQQPHQGGRSKTEVPDHPVAVLLSEDADEETAAQVMVETTSFHALTWGNGFCEIERDGEGIPIALHMIHPSRVRGDRNQAGELIYIVQNDDGTQTPVHYTDMLHLRGMGSTEMGFGVSVLAAECLGLAKAAERFGASFFRNGAQHSGVLKYAGALKEDQVQALKRSWRANYQGAKNTGETPILQFGIDYQQLTIPPEQAQYLMTRQFQIEEIARWFRIAPSKLQHLLKANFNTLEQQDLEHATNTLDPWTGRWRQEVRRKLFAPIWGREYFAEMDLRAMMRGDQKSRAEYYGKLWEKGCISINEIRALENMNPIEDGDDYYVPLNFRRLGEEVEKEEEDLTTENAENTEEEEEEEEEGKEDEEEEEDPSPHPSPEGRGSKARGVMVPVMEEVIRVMDRKEEKARERGLGQNREKLAAFWERHAEQYRAALLPAAVGYAVLLVGEDNRLRAEVAAENGVLDWVGQKGLGSLGGRPGLWRNATAEILCECVEEELKQHPPARSGPPPPKGD